MDSYPIALDMAARVRAAVADELDLLLEDLATWVDVDTPGGNIGALDGLAHVLAHVCERYGLEPECIGSPACRYRPAGEGTSSGSSP